MKMYYLYKRCFNFLPLVGGDGDDENDNMVTLMKITAAAVKTV